MCLYVICQYPVSRSPSYRRWQSGRLSSRPGTRCPWHAPTAGPCSGNANGKASCPPADEEHAELATTGLDGSRKHAFGQFEDGLRLHPELPFGHVVYQLFYDPAGFHDFVHAHHIAVKRITMGIGDFLEVHLAVHRVGMVLAHVVGPSAGTARTAGTAQRDGILTRKQADPLQTGAGNDALRKDVVVFMDNVPQVHDKLFRLPHEIGMQVACTPPITL